MQLPIPGEDDLTADEAESRPEPLPMSQRRPGKKQLFEKSLLQILQHKKGQQHDQETNFALPLVPMLKALSMDKKIEAQIQILQVFKTLNSPSSATSFNTQPESSGVQSRHFDLERNVSQKVSSAPVPEHYVPSLITPPHLVVASTSLYHTPSQNINM